MASNNYVPVKLLRDEISGLLSEQTMLRRDDRLGRIYMIYRLGLIDQGELKIYNREICSKFPPDPAFTTSRKSEPAAVGSVLTRDDLYLIRMTLLGQADLFCKEADRLAQRPNNELLVAKYRQQFKDVTVVSNKVLKVIDAMRGK